MILLKQLDMGKVMVEIKSLYKSYPKPSGKIIIFENLELKVGKGEFVTIMGPSGSGKSTLLNIISTIDSKYEGEVYINERNIKNLNEKEKDLIRLNEIGYVFQFDSLIDELNVIENILLPSFIIEKNSKSKALELLEKFNLKDFAYRLPSELSGGEKQRVALIRAIINSPNLLIADEPTGNLDLENAINVMEDLKKLSDNGITVIIASHNFELAKKYSKKIYRIENKKLINIYEMCKM